MAGTAQAEYVKTQLASFNTSSSTFVNVTGGQLVFVPQNASDVWILLVSARLTSSSINTLTVEARYLVNGTEHGLGGIENDVPSAGSSWQHFYRITGTTATQTVQVQLRDQTGNTATIEDLQLIAFRLPAGADFQYAETEAPQVVTAGAWNTYRDLTFTPSSAGDYLILALANANESPSLDGIGIRLLDPASGIWPDDSDPGTQEGHFDNDRPAPYSMLLARVQTLDATPKTYAIRANGGAGGSTIQYTRLMAFRTDAFAAFESTEDVAETSTTSTTKVVKSTLTTTASSAPREHIVIQSMMLFGPAPFPPSGERRAGFEADGAPQMVYAHTIDNRFIRVSYGFFDAVITANAVQYNNTFSTSSATYQVDAKESSIHVLTLGAPAAACAELTTSEGAGTITVTAPSSFELRFNTAIGGAIDTFNDLAEDPTGVYDLAGGGPTASQQGLFTDEVNWAGDGNNYRADKPGDGTQLDLLEATGVRVRVRSKSFYGRPSNPTLVPGLKGIGDYTIHSAGRTAVRWTREAETSVDINSQQLQLVTLWESSGPTNGWASFSQSGAQPGPFPSLRPGTDDFVMLQNDQAGVRTDFLFVLHQDSPVYAAGNAFAGQNVGGEWFENSWQRNLVQTLPVGTEVWDSMVYFKPTDLVNHSDAAVTDRSADYRGPATPGIMVGTSWQDPDENTASDNFNEAEGAYLFTVDPASGLRFDLDGAATTRFHPLFKMRQWRSLFPPATITFDEDAGGPTPAVTLIRNADYKADVKPMSRAPFADDLLWHSTLQDPGSVSSPDVGSGGGGAGSDFAAGRFGSGARFDMDGERVFLPSGGNFDPAEGAIEFWYQPTYDYGGDFGDLSDDFGLFGYWIGADDFFFAWHEPFQGGLGTGEGIGFRIEVGGVTFETMVGAGPTFPLYWRAREWVHLRFAWKADAATPRLEIYINGTLASPAPSGTYATPVGVDAFFWIGDRENGNLFTNNAEGIIDEFRIYSDADAPTGLAHGGLVGHAEEQLGDGAINVALPLAPVDGASRGEYAYFGSDSKYRGLNVLLATAGASGGTLDLQWEFWNGTSWTGLAVTDETNDFTRNGTVYWTGDPFGWAPYSINGGPDLYYVRAHLANTSAAYTTTPVEGLIRPDLLLFQYCADVTTDNEEFTFAPPVPTSVELLSFVAEPNASAVQLTWVTGSELNNLGFLVYRSLSADGLWTRITPSLIPGLGSSPEGASYSFRDAGLTNGIRYFYKLEDIDSTSGSTFHGPVSATPSASGPGQEEGDEEDPPAPEDPSDPEPSPGETAAYGDRGKPSLRILSRNSRAMVLELTTPGFVATDTPAGVRVSVRGFDARRDPRAPALPLKRALVKGVVGKHARIAWVKERKVLSFPDLTPAAVGAPEVVVGPDGTVQPRRREAPLEATEGVLPSYVAGIAGDAFIGKNKKVALEMNPLRYDAGSGTLFLARKLRVKIAFDRKARTGETGEGSEGTRRPASADRGDAAVLSYLHTLSRGLHAVPYEALGLSGPIPKKALRLSLQGQTVPHFVESRARKFGPGSVLFFHAAQEASSMDFSSETTYALERAKGGVSMQKAPSSMKKLKRTTTAPLAQNHYETNRFYQAGLLDAPDIWLWDFFVDGMSKSLPFSVDGLDAASSQQAHIQVVLQGASDAEVEDEHHLSVSLNGTPLGETSFGGKLPHVFSTSFAASLLLEGENSLTVTNLGDTGAYSFVFLDRFSLVYPRTRTLQAGVFEGVFSQKGKAVVSGKAAYGVDVTNPAAPLWLKLHKKRSRVQFKALAGHHYLLASRAGLLAPRVSKPLRTGLRSSWNQAEYVVIAPAAYLEAARPLLKRRQDQGLETKAVSFEEITSQFGYGRPSAEAIRDFLAYAFHNWTEPSIQYVVLLGDASYDPRNFTGRDKGAPLPALWAKTSYLWTSSDPTLGAVNGEDGLPDLAIGRLPATTVEEAQALVQKVLEWEDTAQSLGGKAILVADNPDIAGDFEADIADIQASFLGGRETESILLRQHGANTRSEVLSALDGGASILSYVGHGGPAVWPPRTFSTRGTRRRFWRSRSSL